MTNEEIKIELRAVINTPAASLTREQKTTIRQIAKSLEMPFNAKEGCSSCYHDFAFKAYSAISEKEAKQASTGDERKYILKPNVDLFFGNIRVNEATMTDELAEYIISRGFERKYFLKCE